MILQLHPRLKLLKILVINKQKLLLDILIKINQILFIMLMITALTHLMNLVIINYFIVYKNKYYLAL